MIDALERLPVRAASVLSGPGLGGSDIPLDSYSMSWKAKSVGVSARLVELANEINGTMPEFVVRHTGDALNEFRTRDQRIAIMVFGVTTDRNVDDLLESLLLAIIELLRNAGAQVDYNYLFAPVLVRGRQGI